MPPRQLLLDYPHLRFSPKILQRLGEELTSHPDQGILELVKNSYDADAQTCEIELLNAASSGGSIVIRDDGLGMNAEQIQNAWLVIGRSQKEERRRTPLHNRIPAGSKGLGRLTALRMGREVVLRTRPHTQPRMEYTLRINWDEVDASDVIDDVHFDVTQSRTNRQDVVAGTTIEIHGLRSKLTRTDVKRLARGILLLADPFGEDEHGFRPSLQAPDFPDFSHLIEKRYFEDADFHLTALLDPQGNATAKVYDWKGSVYYEAPHAEICRDRSQSPYRCPPGRIDLWAYVLSSDSFSQKKVTKQEVANWLKEFGGVHLYIDGIRVAGMGGPGSDWLDLNLLRNRNPELRPGTHTSIGRISLSDEANLLLQKTDRTGLIQNDTFDELKRFAIDSIEWMARRRIEERERLRLRDKEENEKEKNTSQKAVANAIKGLSKPVKTRVLAAIGKVERAKESELSSLRKEVQLYRTLSTAGITAAVFAHESRHPTDIIHQNVELLRRACKKKWENEQDYAAVPGKFLGRMSRSVDSLRSLSNLTLSQIDRDRRRIARVDIHPAVESMIELFAHYTTKREIDIDTNFDSGNPYLRASAAAIDAILTNLFTNSVRAIDAHRPKDRRIVFSTFIADGELRLSCKDTGGGIDESINLRSIWTPGETSYDEGTGLGLTIVRDTVIDLKGKVFANRTSDLGGAEIGFDVPILGA